MLHGASHACSAALIVTGGPQYRVGSHRQFVYLAERLADAGVTTMRFDFRGMGDSGGRFAGFEGVDRDIRAAIDVLLEHVDGPGTVILVGLCDAASANLMYCLADDRVAGLVLLNPWVRTPEGEARSYLRHYYGRRLLQRAFWAKVFSGEYRIRQSIREFLASVMTAREGHRQDEEGADHQRSFIERMLHSLETYDGPIHILISGQDLTAQEFMDLCARDTRWRKASRRSNVTLSSLPDADHTMSSIDDLSVATDTIVDWWPFETR